MQYPVPQFTDVEDRIIGPLTLRQFGIVFGAGAFVMLIYAATKSTLIAGFFAVLVGFPAVAVAFGKFNGRPVYASLPVLIKFFFAPKVLVFHKEVTTLPVHTKMRNVDLTPVKQVAKPKQAEDRREKLKQVNKLLQEQAQKARELVKNKKS